MHGQNHIKFTSHDLLDVGFILYRYSCKQYYVAVTFVTWYW